MTWSISKRVIFIFIFTFIFTNTSDIKGLFGWLLCSCNCTRGYVKHPCLIRLAWFLKRTEPGPWETLVVWPMHSRDAFSLVFSYIFWLKILIVELILYFCSWNFRTKLDYACYIYLKLKNYVFKIKNISTISILKHFFRWSTVVCAIHRR